MLNSPLQPSFPGSAKQERADKLPPEGYSGQWTTRLLSSNGGLLSTAVRYSWTGADDPGFGCNKVLGRNKFEFSAPAKLPAEGRGASRTGSAGKNGGLLLRVVGNSSTSGIYPSFGRNKVLLFD